MFVADIIAMNKEKWEERVALLSTMPWEHFNIGDIKQAMNTLWALSIEAIFYMLTLALGWIHEMLIWFQKQTWVKIHKLKRENVALGKTNIYRKIIFNEASSDDHCDQMEQMEIYI